MGQDDFISVEDANEQKPKFIAEVLFL